MTYSLDPDFDDDVDDDYDDDGDDETMWMLGFLYETWLLVDLSRLDQDDFLIRRCIYRFSPMLCLIA